MTKLYKALGLALALALLTACGQNTPAATPESAATAETAVSWTVGSLYALPQMDETGYYMTRYQRRDEDGLYGFTQLCRVDFDTGEMTPVCQVPGCEHKSRACLSYVDLQSSNCWVAVGDGSLLIYHRAVEPEIRQTILEDYRTYLEDTTLQAERYPGEEGRAYLEDTIAEMEQPSYVDRISADGLARERLATLPEDLNPTISCWDGQALYGSMGEGNLDVLTSNQGVRIGLDGQVDTFPLPDNLYTNVVSGWGQQLVLRHISSPVDLRATYLYGNYNAFYALEQQSSQQCWLYDPVQGTTVKADLGYDFTDNLVPAGSRVVYGARDGDRELLCRYDIPTGETRVLLEDVNSLSSWAIPRAGADPGYLWCHLLDGDAVLHLDSGTWWTAEELMTMAGLTPYNTRYILSNISGETGDDRLLLDVYDMETQEEFYTSIPAPQPGQTPNLAQQAREKEASLVEEVAEAVAP